jgi:hypothetical protein
MPDGGPHLFVAELHDMRELAEVPFEINFDQTFEGLKLSITASPAKTLSVGGGD